MLIYIIFIFILFLILLLLYHIIPVINHGYKIKLLSTTEQLYRYHKQIKTFENKMSTWYPLNLVEEFRIDHGNNYYDFFRRMGKIYMNIVLDKNKKIIGTFSGVLRNINNINIWYLCDLKIDYKHRGNMLTLQIIMNSLRLRNITKKFYAVSMNNGDSLNKVVKLANKISKSTYIKIKTETMYIYSVESSKMEKIKNILELYKGPLYYVNINKLKSLILRSTNKSMNLYHVNFLKNINYTKNGNEQIFSTPIDGTIMFCFHKKDNINNILKMNGIITDTSATIIHNLDFEPSEWDFIQTSEI